MDIFYWALQKGEFKSFLNKDSALPMMYMPDCLKATTMLLEAPTEALKQRCVAKTLSCSPSITAVYACTHDRPCAALQNLQRDGHLLHSRRACSGHQEAHP